MKIWSDVPFGFFSHHPHRQDRRHQDRCRQKCREASMHFQNSKKGKSDLAAYQI